MRNPLLVVQPVVLVTSLPRRSLLLAEVLAVLAISPLRRSPQPAEVLAEPVTAR